MLHNFYCSTILVLHGSLGGAKASQQRQGYSTENRRGEIRQKKENLAAKREFFYILFSHASRHGHSATGAATVKARRELGDTQNI